MKSYKTILLSLSFLVLAGSSCYSKRQPARPVVGTGVSVVELFTSEGCSSCPPAETLLSKLKAAYPSNLLVLEFHVDYWNNIGWKDVYSDAAYSRRQQEYAGFFHLGSVYTPQAVVNGKNELVGSDNAKLTALVKSNLAQTPATYLQVSARHNGNTVSVAYATDRSDGQVLNIALVQKKAETNVKRGENSGKILTHINVVRSFTTVGLSAKEGRLSIELPKGLSPADCSVIAYSQQKDTWQVTGATESVID